MKDENYPIPNLGHALKASKFVQFVATRDGITDLIATSYAIKNRLSKGGELHHIARDLEVSNMGDFSSTCHNTDEEPCLKSLSVVAGVFAGLYDDPTNGATRFHRHDQCPGWSLNLQPCALLGPHLYYRD
ncbi:MAG: hypothetical protein GY948_16095 [Alphaproteobacteria bacterium]|nr:hypothetical protein [Alphaproteobacteria bacterium]